MAAATTVKVSISKDPRRGPWIARTWNWLPTARSLWILPGFISGPRANRANSTIQEHFCRCNGRRRGSAPRIREKQEQIEPLQDGRADDARRENPERKKWQIGWPGRSYQSWRQGGSRLPQ